MAATPCAPRGPMVVSALLVALAFAAVGVVVYTGVAYFAWHSQFAPEDPAAGPPPMPAQFEA